jgi:acetyl-CoA C-acetyltransferase
VVFGNVIQAGVGPNAARLGAVAGGIPMGVPAITVNKLCLSGLAAIAQAAAQVASGYSEIVVAGGTESMTNAPHLLPGSRKGIKYGGAALADALDHDGLVCGFEGVSMGAATEKYQVGLGISRDEQDEFAAESHTRAAAAIKDGRLAEEIVPVTIAGRKGPVTVEEDEGVRPGTTHGKLAALPPAFAENGR